MYIFSKNINHRIFQHIFPIFYALYREGAKSRNRGPLERLKRILQLSILGWPLYLITDATGPPKHDELSWVNHFNPYCEYFPQYMVNLVLLSDIGLFIFSLYISA